VAALGPFFYALLAWLLFASSLFFIFRSPPSRFALSYLLTTFFLLPLMLNSLAAYPALVGLIEPFGFAVVAAFLIVPLLYLLDDALKQYAGEMGLVVSGKPGSSLTHLSRALFSAALAGLILALVIGQPVLLLAAGILLGYLLIVVLMSYRRFYHLPVAVSQIVMRVIAGNEAVVTSSATGCLNLKLRVGLTSRDDWLKVVPGQFSLDKTHPETELVFSLLPPLSGPAHPTLTLSVLDNRGLIKNDRVISPLELHVIPRAKYAEWLAKKYLLESGGMVSTVPVLSSEKLVPERAGSGEYYQSREYQAGDSIKDIDWKHTLKLGQMVVKERIDFTERLAVLVVNLSVADAEGADKLAYRFVTTTMTLSRDMVPLALVVYRHDKVVLVTPPSEPREMLKQALRLLPDIRVVGGRRCLSPLDIFGLKRDIVRLSRVDSRPARRLRALLEFEYRAVEKTAGEHPVTEVLLKATGRLLPPAAVIMLSEMNHDAEALIIAGERLKKRGFATYFFDADRI
jgi:uncharacterized protein (DUF58 family)